MSHSLFSLPPSDLRKVLVLIRGTRGDNEPFWPACARLLEVGIDLTVITSMQSDDFFQEVDNSIALFNKHQPKRITQKNVALQQISSAHSAVAAANTITNGNGNSNGETSASFPASPVTVPAYASHPTFGSRFRLWSVKGELECCLKDLAWLRAAAENGVTVKRYYEVIDKQALFDSLHKIAAIVGFVMPDLIVEDLFLYGQIMAQTFSIPSIVLAAQPADYDSDEMPPMHYRPTPFPFKLLNRWSHFFFFYIYLGSSMVDNHLQMRKEFNLPLAFWSHDPEENHSIIAISPKLFPQPADAPARLHFIGGRSNVQDADWLPAGWRPSDDLLKFLQVTLDGEVSQTVNGKKEKREPVIYIGLGSMPAEAADATSAQLATELLQVSEELGVRLLLSGAAMKAVWNALIQQYGDNSVQLRDRVRFESSAPHAWLFKRVSGIIHHGGVGTTMTALGSGTPQAIFAIGFDQPFWAYRIHLLTAESTSDSAIGHPKAAQPFKVTWAVKARGSDYRSAIQTFLNPATREKFLSLGHTVSDESCSSDAILQELWTYFESRRFNTSRRLGIIPQWKNSEQVKNCEICELNFSCMTWKYQCYACGKYICKQDRAEKTKHITTFGPRCYPCKGCAKVWEDAEQKIQFANATPTTK